MAAFSSHDKYFKKTPPYKTDRTIVISGLAWPLLHQLGRQLGDQ